MRTSVVIPALNEEASIGLVLGDLPTARLDQVVVVDNGSTDSTAHVAKAHGAVVLSEPLRGYGYACLKGIEHLSGNPPDVVVFLDGDYADHPEQLVRVTDPIETGTADFVIGSRMIGRREAGALLPQARFGNWLASLLMRLGWGARFTDLGPFRAIRWKDLQRLGMSEGTFGWTIEMQIKAVEAGLTCTEVPVDYRKRIGKSKVTGTVAGTVKASFWILWVLGTYAVTRGRRSY